MGLSNIYARCLALSFSLTKHGSGVILGERHGRFSREASTGLGCQLKKERLTVSCSLAQFISKEIKRKRKRYEVLPQNAVSDGPLRPLQAYPFQQPWNWVSQWGLILALMLITPSVRAETPEPEPLAEVNGEAITGEDLGDALGVKIAQLQEKIYSLQSQKLEALITNRLLTQEGAKRGMTVAALLDAEVTGKVGLVTETEVEAFYQANKSRFLGEEAVIREKIRASLQQRKLAAHRKLFVSALRANAQVRISLKPPPVIRVAVSTDGAPVRGMAEAPVTLVEFSDFHCPFCKHVQPTLEQLLARYPQQVTLVFRDFPLDKLHPQARHAAEAARCAHEQGKFWEYHDLLFTNAPKASSKDLGKYAEQVGLDGEKFQVCLSDGGQQAAVQQDVADGARLGITGTPMFFINGRPLSGALPLERFVQVIEEELVRHPATKEKVDSGG